LAIVIVLLAAATWWVYGTPLPARLARQQLSPAAATAGPAVTSVEPEAPPAPQIYRAVPSTLYRPEAPSTDSPEQVTAPEDTTGTVAPGPATQPLSITGFEREADGLPRMAPPPR
jgi:hypothetical protein